MGMGQSASKATEAAKRAAPSIANTARTQRAPLAAAEADAWKRSAAAPSSGETETPAPRRRDARRSQRHQADAATALAATASRRKDALVGGDGAVPEMPPDLIDFLNDAGPLQRRVDKARTSARVYDALARDDHGAREEERRQARQANVRVRRKMPLVAGVAGDDGTTTERTTNFSTTDRAGPPEFGVAREDLVRLAEATQGAAVGSPRWQETLDREYRSMVADRRTKDADGRRDRALFEDSVRYIGVPVLVRDTDGDVIGVWRRTAEKLDHSLGMKRVPAGEIDFAWQNEGPVTAEVS